VSQTSRQPGKRPHFDPTRNLILMLAQCLKLAAVARSVALSPSAPYQSSKDPVTMHSSSSTHRCSIQSIQRQRTPWPSLAPANPCPAASCSRSTKQGGPDEADRFHAETWRGQRPSRPGNGPLRLETHGSFRCVGDQADIRYPISLRDGQPKPRDIV
jgi:hypothetical protein